MTKPHGVVEIFLQPGDFYFGDEHTRIRTLLGSCVSITLWHPLRKIGGMCHYMLPSRGKESAALDGRYADEAMKLFMKELKASKTHPSEYEVKLFGGGNMFPGIARKSKTRHVSDKNVEMGRALVAQYGFSIKAEHLGGDGHRNIIFDVWSGHVWLKHAATAVESAK